MYNKCKSISVGFASNIKSSEMEFIIAQKFETKASIIAVDRNTIAIIDA